MGPNDAALVRHMQMLTSGGALRAVPLMGPNDPAL